MARRQGLAGDRVFVLPSVLLSALGGEIADSHDKALVARRLKFAEIFVQRSRRRVSARSFGAAVRLAVRPRRDLLAVRPDQIRHPARPTAQARSWSPAMRWSKARPSLRSSAASSSAAMPPRPGVPGPVVAQLVAVALSCWLTSRWIPADRGRRAGPEGQPQPPRLDATNPTRIEARRPKLGRRGGGQLVLDGRRDHAFARARRSSSRASAATSRSPPGSMCSSRSASPSDRCWPRPACAWPDPARPCPVHADRDGPAGDRHRRFSHGLAPSRDADVGRGLLHQPRRTTVCAGDRRLFLCGGAVRGADLRRGAGMVLGGPARARDRRREHAELDLHGHRFAR